MPLVRVSLLKGRPVGLRRQIGDAIQHALVETSNLPRRDRIQQITMSVGRTLAQRRALFRRLADSLAALGLRREDAWVNLVEVAKENWSFAHLPNEGEASYAQAETIPG